MENAEIKRQNEIIKTRIDLEVTEIRERKDTTSVLMGKVLEDMTKASREMIEKCHLPRAEGVAGATTSDEARVLGDWSYYLRDGETYPSIRWRGGRRHPDVRTPRAGERYADQDEAFSRSKN